MNDLIALARKEVRALASYNAGLSAEAVKKLYAVDTISKLGSNENPLGVSPKATKAMQDAMASTAIYPDANCTALREALAEKLDIDPARFVFGNGSEDLISIISRVFLDHGDEVVTVLPSFGLHILYPEAVGATVTAVPLTADYQFDIDAMLDAVTPRTRLMMFSSPSNPAGCIVSPAELQKLLDQLPTHCLLVFDEAYFEYVHAADDQYADYLALLEASNKPYILLRTFSKAYSLAALRVGYGIVSDLVFADLIDRVRTPFNVNAMAQAAAVAALNDQEHLDQGMVHINQERSRMLEILSQSGLSVPFSYGNFLFIALPCEAETVYKALLTKGIIVKAWKEKGYTHCIRVSVGSTFDNNRFLDAFLAILKEEQ